MCIQQSVLCDWREGMMREIKDVCVCECVSVCGGFMSVLLAALGAGA